MSEFVKALATAQAEMGNAAFNRVNPHFKSKYADFAAVREATLPILNKHGFAIIQTLIDDMETQRMFLRTELAHVSGDSRCSLFPIAPGTPQQQGSAITYARRYSWSAICGIASEEDDDGNEASKGEPVKSKSAHQARKDGIYPILEREIRSLSSLSDLKVWWVERQDDIRSLPPSWIVKLEEEKDRLKLKLADAIEETNGNVENNGKN